MISALIAAGTLVFAYASGRLITRGVLSRHLSHSALACHALGMVVGLAFLTPVLVALAAAGLFRTTWMGAIGWVASLLIAAAWPKCPARRAVRVDRVDLIVLLGAIVFVVAASSGRDESLGAGRDQQIYAAFAVALAKHGTFALRYAPLDEADSALLSKGYRKEACTAYVFKTFNAEHRQSPFVVPGGLNACDGVESPIGFLHPSGWPVWLAIVHSVFGVEGMYAANVLVFALGGVIFFVQTRLVAAPVISAAAALLLWALPISLWMAGISLSEPLAMALLLAIPVVATARKRRRALIAALAIAAMLVRVDAVIVVPTLMLAELVATCSSPTPARLTACRKTELWLLLTLSAGFLSYAILFPRYLEATFDTFALTGAASAGLALVAMTLAPTMAARTRDLISSLHTRLLAIFLLAVLFLYAAAVRPTLEPFSSIKENFGLYGTRDFREDSLRNLAVYLSWPIVVAAGLGVAWAIWRRWGSRGGLLRPLLLMLALVPALVYLWSPHVSPDHPWAFRRFIPLVVPGVLLFAATLVNALARRTGQIGSIVGALALLCLPAVLLMQQYPTGVLLMRENDGLTKQIAAIATQLPGGLIVADSSLQDIGSALFAAFDKPVAVADGALDPYGDPTAITEWIEAKAASGHPAWLLHAPDTWQTGAKWSDRQAWWITRDVVVPSFKPPAKMVEKRTSQIILSRVDGLDRTFASRMFGGERIWGVREHGFFGTEIASFGMFRYTNGDAWLEVPTDPLRAADGLKVDVFTFAKEGVQRWLRIGIDGHAAWEGNVAAGLATIRVPIPHLPAGDVARIQIQSERADPADMGADDPRVGLSVGLLGIRPFRRSDTVVVPFESQGFCSALKRVAGGPGPIKISGTSGSDFVADVSNCGSESWRSKRDAEAGAEGSVQIALRWRERGKPNTIVADNRWPLSLSLLPGDRTKIKVPLKPVGGNGQRLRPGEYDVDVAFVHEPGALLSHGPNASLSIPVTLAP